MDVSLCALPEVCLIKILRFLDEEGQEEMKFACRHVNRLLNMREVSVVRRKRVHLLQGTTAKKCWPTALCNIEETKEDPRKGRSLLFGPVRRVQIRSYVGKAYSIDRIIKWSNDEDTFEHPALGHKMMFEWMAKECRNYRADRLYFETDLDEEGLRCYERLADEYGIRANQVEISYSDTTSIDNLLRLFKVFKPSSLKAYLYGQQWVDNFRSPKMLNFISSLKSFEGVSDFKSVFNTGVAPNEETFLPGGIYKLPPHFVFKEGIKVGVETVANVVRNWYDEERSVENIEELILPREFWEPAALVAHIRLPNNYPMIGISHITIYKWGSRPLKLRLMNPDGYPELPRWRIHKSYSFRENCNDFVESTLNFIWWTFIFAAVLLKICRIYE